MSNRSIATLTPHARPVKPSICTIITCYSTFTANLIRGPQTVLRHQNTSSLDDYSKDGEQGIIVYEDSGDNTALANKFDQKECSKTTFVCTKFVCT